MPHQCTDCGRTFEDGSKEMLSGCPDCGGNKFQFHPDGVDADAAGTEQPPEPPEPTVDSSVARTVGNAATAVRDLVGSSSPPDPPGTEDEQPSVRSDAARDRSAPSSTAESTERPTDDSSDRTPSVEPGSAEMAQSEDEAQASARSEVVSPDDLPPASETRTGTTPRSTTKSTTDASSGPSTPDESGSGSGTPERADRPDLSELREELNEQFESIRVLEPGQYELNLMSLYDREEYIIALQEDGKYTIQVPERWED